MHTFTELPAEIRNQIYRDVLVPDLPYVDFSPKTTVSEMDEEYAAALGAQRQRYIDQVQPSLRLLRTCKQIHAEASSIFYGEVEFRCTSVKGWYVLDAWLQQIGSRNQALLRKLAVHVPWPCVTKDSWKDDLPESGVRLEVMCDTIRALGLTPRPKWQMKHVDCLRRTKDLLESHGKLKSLRLILPDTCELPATNGAYDPVFDAAKFEGLRLALVRLEGGHISGETNTSTISTHVDAERMVGELGWEFVVESYNGKGEYPVEVAGEEQPDPEETEGS